MTFSLMFPKVLNALHWHLGCGSDRHCCCGCEVPGCGGVCGGGWRWPQVCRWVQRCLEQEAWTVGICWHSMPEGGLGEPASWGPRSSRGVVDLHHVRQLKSVVIATGHIESTAQSCYTASNMNLWKVRHFSYLCECLMWVNDVMLIYCPIKLFKKQ